MIRQAALSYIRIANCAGEGSATPPRPYFRSLPGSVARCRFGRACPHGPAAVPAPGNLLDQLGAECGQVVRTAARDQTMVHHDLLIHDFGAGTLPFAAPPAASEVLIPQSRPLPGSPPSFLPVFRPSPSSVANGVEITCCARPAARWEAPAPFQGGAAASEVSLRQNAGAWSYRLHVHRT